MNFKGLKIHIKAGHVKIVIIQHFSCLCLLLSLP